MQDIFVIAIRYLPLLINTTFCSHLPLCKMKVMPLNKHKPFSFFWLCYLQQGSICQSYACRHDL